MPSFWLKPFATSLALNLSILPFALNLILNTYLEPMGVLPGGIDFCLVDCLESCGISGGIEDGIGVGIVDGGYVVVGGIGGSAMHSNGDENGSIWGEGCFKKGKICLSKRYKRFWKWIKHGVWKMTGYEQCPNLACHNVVEVELAEAASGDVEGEIYEHVILFRHLNFDVSGAPDSFKQLLRDDIGHHDSKGRHEEELKHRQKKLSGRGKFFSYGIGEPKEKNILLADDGALQFIGEQVGFVFKEAYPNMVTQRSS
ncbi:hypothetical protein Tco_1087742 [Tanacetum coccineum]